MTDPQVIAPRPKGGRPAWLPDALAGAVATALLVTVTAHLAPPSDGREMDVLGYVTSSGPTAPARACPTAAPRR